jgi:tRNA(fMet)-specific endonuclease VapC
MRDALLDTNIVKDFLVGDPDTIEAFQRARQLCINTIVLAELLTGFALGSRPDANRRLLSRLLSSPRVSLLTVGPETAEHYADICTRLRRKGRPIPTNDMWIAASAREHGLVLFTRDAHFQEVDGLLTASSVDQLLP